MHIIAKNPKNSLQGKEVGKKVQGDPFESVTFAAARVQYRVQV